MAGVLICVYLYYNTDYDEVGSITREGLRSPYPRIDDWALRCQAWHLNQELVTCVVIFTLRPRMCAILIPTFSPL
jgi:hypothetical protein